MKFLLPLVAAAAGLTLSAPALAQDASPAPDPATIETGGDSITVGGGLAYLPDYEGSDDYRFVPAPGAIGQYKGFAFLLAGNRLSVDLIPNRPGPVWDVQAGPIGVVNFNRNSLKSIDDPRIRALGELDTAIELGGYVGIGKTGVVTSPYDKLSVSLSYRKDVAGAHKAGILQPTINYLTPLSLKAAVGLFASAERAEAGYATYYYSISPTQRLASGLPTYTARGGWKNYSLGALGTYAITGDLLKGFKAVGGINYRRMLNDFGESPVTRIAGSRNQWLAALGVAYTF
ncbi:structural protein MipA [Sphingomonas sp. Leaf33]|uniref:MipA/OmpV family protein n=1 Tax=Sphingomonas sp. Leaf33 TaxID=1736215 RepID=UPI0006F9AC04|nr:MipA/OmpV family protein [Sphingomonas sp. Leaf33]KQN25035.1 structural protein MipA [Sphingomonas sp. Leaf33]